MFFNDEDNGWEWSSEAGLGSSSSLTFRNRIGNEDGSIDYIISPSFNPSVSTQEVVDFNIYPNPSSGTFLMDMSLVESGALSIDLMDIRGSLVKSLLNENVTSGDFNFNFNITDLSKGVYFLKVTHNGVNTMKKLVIQ